MKLVIFGCRDIKIEDVVRPINQEEALWVFDMLEYHFKDKHITEVVSGHARGVDRMGELWAESRKIPVKQFIPDWNKFGKRAGFLRNVEMAEYADQGIGFWDGVSRGTKMMRDELTNLSKAPIMERFDAPF